ncbi:MAG: class I SAM-dependent methyltransferase [Bauldia sp.]|mgnify:CR=1 FL=1
MTSHLRSIPLVEEILTSGQVTDATGARHKLRSGTAERFLDALHDTVVRVRPATAVEIGMANGVSSIAIAAGLMAVPSSGRLISIDPFQHRDWHGVGVEHMRRLGFGDRHTLMEEPSFLALPRLLERGTVVDLAYIDGWHTFDYTLVDFFYLDKMLPVGGVVAFNDAGWRAVHKVIKFALSHRRYEEMDVGLKREYGSPIPSLRKIAAGRSGADRYFRKLENWEPKWDFFANF